MSLVTKATSGQNNMQTNTIDFGPRRIPSSCVPGRPPQNSGSGARIHGPVALGAELRGEYALPL